MNEQLKYLKNHPILTQEQDIKNLCKPLALLNISTFTHLHVDSEQRLTGLSNHPKCWVNYIEKDYVSVDPQVLIKPEVIDIGQYLVWDAIKCQGKAAEMFSENAIDFNFKHVFTIIRRQNTATDYYNFGTHLSDPGIHLTYINNLDLLIKFINHFNDETSRSKLLSSAYDIVINPPSDVHPIAIEQSASLHFIETRQLFIKAMSSAGFNNYQLTAKEMHCALLLIEGKTAKEIAKICNLSFRTIEDRINVLKRKFNADKKSDLIVKLLRWL